MLVTQIHTPSLFQFAKRTPPSPLGQLNLLIVTWKRRCSVRAELEHLRETSPHLICDIGLTLEEVEAEVAKRFWEQ